MLKIDPADGESDLDIDFQAVQDEFNADDSESDDESKVDDLPRLPCGDWSMQLHSVSDDKFTENVGVCHDLGVGAEPLQYFQLFFPDSVFAMIATETNRYAEQVQAEKRFDSKWHPTTGEEIKLYIAINVMIGIHILPRVENYWSTDDKLNVPCISRLMSRTRFEKLDQYLHLNCHSNNRDRGQPGFDPIFKVRPLLEFFRVLFFQVQAWPCHQHR